MKSIAMYGLVFVLFSAVSCSQVEELFDKEKKEKENLCPVVELSAVPQAVVDSFNSNFPGMNVVNWFDKDGTGFSALFTKENQETIAHFDLNGVLVRTEVDVEQEGNHSDSEEEDTGCECETADDEG